MLYAIIGWIGWWFARRRFEGRLGPVLLFVLYAIAMAAFFLLATVMYLVIEYRYRGGQF